MHAIQGCVFRKTDMARPACGSKLASGGRQDKTEISSALKHSDSIHTYWWTGCRRKFIRTNHFRKIIEVVREGKGVFLIFNI